MSDQLRVVLRCGDDDAIHALAPVVLDGVPSVIGKHGDGSLTLCALSTGDRTALQLDLDGAGPDGPAGMYGDDEDPDDEDVADEPGEADAEEVVSRLASATLDGRPVLVTGGGRFDLTSLFGEDHLGGVVRCWDLVTGERIGEAVTGHGLGVNALAIVPSERGRLVLSSSEEGVLIVSVLGSGERLGEIQGGYGGAMAAAVVDGRPLAVTGGEDPCVQVWDVLTGGPVGDPLKVAENCVHAIAVTEVAGRAVALTCGDDNALRTWELATGRPLGVSLAGHADVISGISLIDLGGRPVAVTEAEDEPPRIWDLARAEQLGEPLTVPGESAPTAVTTTEIDGEPVVVTGYDDGTIRVWNIPGA
ncbi:WD40 repeat domain-containing protein [Saccharomonospora xinjiangensis]|uniref:WD40 repeat domain-containing protein n=1 Tax=Saccharomonospora xinjiangensis TaxID=75294 RepID=UPI00350FBCD1